MHQNFSLVKLARSCFKLILLVTLSLLPALPVIASETIIMLRHGEKPEAGLGQLSCQGLNRSLALPRILFSNFGKPTAIYAPNPSDMKADHGIDYSYIRPLATIEPTAIAAGLPVNVQIKLNDIEQLNASLLDPRYRDATIFVVWEHKLLEKAARQMVARLGGNPQQVPKWNSNDFDSLYVIHVNQAQDSKRSVSFNLEKQGLNTLDTACPDAPLNQ